jgi:uracil phosphoribosyltransferase
MADPMLATGSSMLDAIDRLIVEGGKPAEVHVIAAIAAIQGIERVREGLESRGFRRASIWSAAIDPELNEHGYIVPGLGDAGDLAYGPKIQN